MTDLNASFRRTTTFFFDVDGVFTDGSIQVSEEGHLLRTMSIRDGFAVKTAIQAGYRVCVITGGSSAGVGKRFAALGVLDVYSGVGDKVEVLGAYAQRHGVELARALYIGDDLPDVGPMRRVGLACAPADAAPEVLAVAHFVSARAGGGGCVRDVVERVLRLNGHWPAV